MTVLTSFNEELVSDAGRWRTLKSGAQLWLKSPCCADDARWLYLRCKWRSRAKIDFTNMNWWDLRSGGWNESKPAVGREDTRSLESYCTTAAASCCPNCQPVNFKFLIRRSQLFFKRHLTGPFEYKLRTQCTRMIRLHVSIYYLAGSAS